MALSYRLVAFHRLRLLREAGQPEEARKELDDVLAQSGAVFPLSAQNQFLALRMELSTSLDEFLRNASRFPTDPGAGAWQLSASAR